jgi:secondary thiamine-phosphate synthase enzyme
MERQAVPGLAHAHATLAVETRGTGFTDITLPVARIVSEWGAIAGTLTLFIRHTSASLVIQENTDPDVQADLTGLLADIAPAARAWRHRLEGPDDMPAHAKAMLTAASLSIPVVDGQPALGTWQAIYVAEHRARAHKREVVLSFIGLMR